MLLGPLCACALGSIHRDPPSLPDAAHYSAETLQCAAAVAQQVQMAGKEPPMPAILAFCVAVVRSPDLKARSAPQGNEPTGVL
jgi:hypothetical protein